MGGSVLYATDDYFAEKENLIRPSAPVWKEHEYTDRGKWMDGWESRRKRVPGHDFAVVRLGVPGVIRGVVIDTAFFRGNFPSHASIEAAFARPESDLASLLGEATQWIEILPRSELQGNAENLFAIASPFAFTHVRLRIYPDGGVARFRVHGEVVPEWRRSGGLLNEIDLAAAEHGAQVLTCSDMFFGPKHNLIMPGRAHNMSDGWETKRRRGPGHDWAIVQLATEGVVRRIEVDTNHFKGNFPDTCSIDSARSADGDWQELLPRTKLQAHTRHFFIDELLHRQPTTYIRMNVYPDGGISRLRVHAVATEEGRGNAAAQRINTRIDPAAELRSCCGSSAWVAKMIARRPFANWMELSTAADDIWSSLGPDDWREAFAAHPRIGEKRDGARWSAAEQAGTSGAANETMQALAEANRQYEERFGHVFLICATGRTADEMLAAARSRLCNTADDELRIAAEEQRKITRLRLLKQVAE